MPAAVRAVTIAKTEVVPLGLTETEKATPASIPANNCLKASSKPATDVPGSRVALTEIGVGLTVEVGVAVAAGVGVEGPPVDSGVPVGFGIASVEEVGITAVVAEARVVSMVGLNVEVGITETDPVVLEAAVRALVELAVPLDNGEVTTVKAGG